MKRGRGNRIIGAVIVTLLAGSCSDDSTPNIDSGTNDTGADKGQHEGGAPDGPLPDGGLVDAAADTQPGYDSLPGADALLIPCSAAAGSATISGTLGGVTPKVTHAVSIRGNITSAALSAYGIGLWNKAGSCQTLIGKGDPDVAIQTCAKGPGTFPIGQVCQTGIKGATLKNGVKIPGTPAIKATAGTITITSYDEKCGGKVKGSFSASLGTELLTGSFEAGSCGVLNQ